MGGRKRAVSPSPRHGGPTQVHRFTTAGAFWGGLLRAQLNLFPNTLPPVHENPAAPPGLLSANARAQVIENHWARFASRKRMRAAMASKPMEPVTSVKMIQGSGFIPAALARGTAKSNPTLSQHNRSNKI